MPIQELSIGVDWGVPHEQVLVGSSNGPLSGLPTPVAQNKANPPNPESPYPPYTEDSTDPPSKLPQTTSNTIASQSVFAQRSSPVQYQGLAARRRLPPIPGSSSPSPISSTDGFQDSRSSHDSTRSQESPLTISSASYNDPHGYHSGGGPSNDYLSIDPKLPKQPQLSPALHQGSSRSTASPTIPPPPPHLKDDVGPVYGRRERGSPTSLDLARPHLPKIPPRPTQISKLSIPTEALLSPYPDSGGPNGTGASIYTNDRSGVYVLPPLPHQAYPPDQPMNPHTDSPYYTKNMTFSPGPLASTSRHSAVNLDQHNSITPTNTPGEHTVSRPSSSAGTNMYQGDFAVSRVRPLPQSYPDIKIPVPLEGDYSQDSQHGGGHAEGDDFYNSEEDDSAFVNFALLSHLAVRLRDRVPRGTHVKGRIPYPRAFTGKDIVTTIRVQIQREMFTNHRISTNDQRAAIEVARSLQSQLFFYEVEWGGGALNDGTDDVYMFLDDQEGSSDPSIQMEELPTGVVTCLTNCYTPSCVDEHPCYAYSCPRRGQSASSLSGPAVEAPAPRAGVGLPEPLPPDVFASLPRSEANRQTIIRKIISMEQQYLKDLDFIDKVFIRPLRNADPPIIKDDVDEFIEEVFSNILDLREFNRNLLEAMHLRQREQNEIVLRIGDIFLNAATEFRLVYPTYIGQRTEAEKRLKKEIESNGAFRMFLEQCFRHPDNINKMDLKHWLNRPSEHLHKYPVVFEAIRAETAEGDPDIDFLKEAVLVMRNLQGIAQLRTFQKTTGRGLMEWCNLVPEGVRNEIGKQEAKRQAIIFEFIQAEMAYVKDLGNVERIYLEPLRSIDPPIIPPERLETFIQDVFCSIDELHAHHKLLLDKLFEIQREEHPVIWSIARPMYELVLNFREVYLKYFLNYPVAAYRIDDEVSKNPQFKDFVERCVRHPDAHRLDMKHFVHRSIPYLLRSQLVFQAILRETPTGHGDLETIPAVLGVIKDLGKEAEPGVVLAKRKVELWRCNANLIFRAGEHVDMDLLNEGRTLIHSGKLLREPETGFEWKGWIEVFAWLFDNYLVLTKPKEKDGVTKYNVYRRPIPLDLLTLVSFTDHPTQRVRLLHLDRKMKDDLYQNVSSPFPGTGPDTPNDARVLYPCVLRNEGRSGGLFTLFTESAQERLDWQIKLEEAIGLRKVSKESNKVFEMKTLSADTFFTPTLQANPGSFASDGGIFTGKVTCSIPFNSVDGRPLVAIGCAEGVWIGFRHDSRSMRRVLHLRMVTQCALLEDFGIFLVLADKVLFAYHIEALVPSSPVAANASQTPQKLSGNKDVQFFAVGNLGGKTLVIYMKKKNLDSVFRVLEPVVGKINERTRVQPTIGSRLGLRSQRSEWFRVYRDFFLPLDSYNLLFLKARIVILCSKGFEIMDLLDFKSVTIPQKEDPRLEKLAKRTESCKPLGMFRSNKDEFLLCYDEFGLYVDNHGDPNRSMGVVEWEGRAERVAWHPPYILLFGNRFVEIRHVETNRLVQIIPGNDVRCTWDGRGDSQSQAIPEVPQDEAVSQEQRVHAVMNLESPQPGRKGATTQHVFELIPTVPLSSLGPLVSPLHASHFNQLHSPPLTPNLDPQHPKSGGFVHAGIALGAPGSSIVTESDTPAWKRLISRSLLPFEVISLIEAVFTSKDEVKMICDLRGDDAQTFINTIHEALNLPDLSPRVRAKCLSALCRICGRQALLPRSLQIPICYNRSDNPLYHGGFADIWKGEHKGCHVAVKVLRVYSTSDMGKITSRFCKEVVTWNALCHPNVLPLLGITMDKNQFAMVSEWMVNGNINEFIKEHWEANPFELLKQVVNGLIYIHDQGMIHGDLKGANILIDQNKQARLADFGLLTIVSDHSSFTTSSSTFTGGTIRWMSPELLHPEQHGFGNGRPTKESDCYALGMVFYEVLAGQHPFTPFKDYIVMRMVTDGERPERPEGAKGVWFTDDLWQMLSLCWETNPQSRPSIEAVLEYLKRISSTWRPLPPQVNEDAERNENDFELTVLTELAL